MRDTDGDGKADQRDRPLQPVRLQGHARHDQLLHLGLRRLGLRLPRLLQQLDGQGRRRPSRSPCSPATSTACSPTAPTSSISPTARSTRSAWPSIRWATSTRATATASRSTSSCAAATIPASASRTTASASAPSHARPLRRLDGHRRHRLLRRRPVPGGHRDSGYIGDVVTNRINQFRLSWHGSTPVASKQDFLVSDDRWFRPVDVKLGPDGALYVADFYNRIIGHYEVPLNHPGRDRERGRIWRIVYCGPDGQRPDAAAAARRLDDQARRGADEGPRPPQPGGAHQGDQPAGPPRRRRRRRRGAGHAEGRQAGRRRYVAADAWPVGAGAHRRPGRRHADGGGEGQGIRRPRPRSARVWRSGRSGRSPNMGWRWPG